MFKHSKLAHYVFLTLAVQVLVSCSNKEEINFFPDDVLEQMYAPFRSSSSIEQSSSSSAELSSSSNEQGSSSSVEALSSSSAESSSSSGEQGSSSSVEQSSSGGEQSSSSDALCGGKPYTSSQFCLNNAVTDKCDGTKEYQAGEFCSKGGNVYTLCGNLPYTDDEFCLDDTVTDKCNGITYLNTQFCHESKSVKDKCGGTSTGDKYVYGTEQCCGSKKYNPTSHFCYNNTTIVEKCGVEETYNLATQFCYNNSKIGNYCGNRTETFDPDLYECKPNINVNGIYLKNKPKDDAGKEYDAVLIGTQIWMAENLNYNVDGSKCGSTLSGVGTLSGENAVTCNTYGRLYNWTTAMGGSASSTNNPSGVQGVCPSGWHLPSNAEWNILIRFVNPSCSDNETCNRAGTKLKATSGWNAHATYGNGTDDYGFSALPGGYGNSSGIFNSGGYFGFCWSASEYNSDNAYGRSIYYDGESAVYTYYNKDSLYSVRCLQN